jgi:hypothetical protein
MDRTIQDLHYNEIFVKTIQLNRKYLRINSHKNSDF